MGTHKIPGYIVKLMRDTEKGVPNMKNPPPPPNRRPLQRGIRIIGAKQKEASFFQKLLCSLGIHFKENFINEREVNWIPTKHKVTHCKNCQKIF